MAVDVKGGGGNKDRVLPQPATIFVLNQSAVRSDQTYS
jgi:hypothetical protein